MRFLLFFILMLYPALSRAGLFPGEGAALNYRIVGFSALPVKKGTLEIAKGSVSDIATFTKSIIITQQFDHTRTIAELPAFGTPYTWRIKEDKTNTLHHFSTLAYDFADTAKARLRIISNTGAFADNYIFVDRANTLYNMKGEPVWFVPVTGNTGTLRDIKLTPQSTVTFIAGEQVAEIDYNGHKLWNGPNDGTVSGDTAECYHHEFTRLANGHYMVLGTAHGRLPLPSYPPGAQPDSARGIYRDAKGSYVQQIEFGTVIEYDQSNHIVWSWKSSAYFTHTEMFDHYLPDGSLPSIDVHENAFYFDEQHKALYVGFKNISRIVKLKYPDGTILASYGLPNPDSKPIWCNNDFCAQHSIQLSANGDIMLFNNNSTSFTNQPQALLLQERSDPPGLAAVWRFECPFDGVAGQDLNVLKTKQDRLEKMYPPEKVAYMSMQVSPGGNMLELPGHNYFVSMSGAIGKMFIVSQSKEILWSAVPEFRIFDGASFTTQGTYRAHIISKQDFEKFIWAAQ